MLNLELRARFDEVRLAMERVRSGESESEKIWLPSGDTVTIHRDANAPIGIRIQTPSDARRPRSSSRTDSRWASSSPGPRSRVGSDWGREVLEAREYAACETRPSGYPSDLPFLPGCAVSVSLKRSEDGSRRARSAVWAGPPEPTRTLNRIKVQLQADGWDQVKTSQASTYVGNTLSSSFRKGQISRVLSLMVFGEFSQIMLFEKPE